MAPTTVRAAWASANGSERSLVAPSVLRVARAIRSLRASVAERTDVLAAVAVVFRALAALRRPAVCGAAGGARRGVRREKGRAFGGEGDKTSPKNKDGWQQGLAPPCRVD